MNDANERRPCATVNLAEIQTDFSENRWLIIREVYE